MCRLQEAAASSPESSGGEGEGEGESAASSIGSADLGKRVVFFSSQNKKEKYGTLRYFGRPEFAAGQWCGVELDKAEGKNNGSKHGIRYFTCEPGYGVFVPAEKVELDYSRRARSRPNSRPGSRPSSAERGKKGGRGDPGSAAKPTAVQQELARLTQAPVADRQLPKRRGSHNAVTNWRQPLKAFAQPTESSNAKQSCKVPVSPLRSGGGFGGSSGVHKAASSENIRALTARSRKKSSSEKNIASGNTLPRVSGPKSGKRFTRTSSASTADSVEHADGHQWPRMSSPCENSRENNNGVLSSHSSNSSSGGASPEEPSCMDNAFIARMNFIPPSPPFSSTSSAATLVALPTGLATQASQLAEAEKLSSIGPVRIPSPELAHKPCYHNSVHSGEATLYHPLTKTAELPVDLSNPSAMAALLTQLAEQNRLLQERQGSVCVCVCKWYSIDRDIVQVCLFSSFWFQCAWSGGWMRWWGR